MLLLFASFILGQSSDYTINFAESNYDLFLNSSGVFVRQQNENEEIPNFVYSSTNVEDYTVHLSISLNFDESKDHILNIVVDPMKVNLDLEIEILNVDKNLYPGICVHDKSNIENDYYNYYTITIHSETIFYYDMTDWAIGTIEAYSLNNQLITRVSLSEEKFFYNSYSYICYKSTDCLSKFSIRPYDSYFIATDDTMLNLFINDVYANEYDQTFYILFDKINDFPHLNDKITNKNVHLMGIAESPVLLRIDNNINIDQLTLTNIQFVKKNQDEILNLIFDTISINDETKSVFPTTGCTITCNKFYEYRINSDASQFESITALEKGCFYISPDFDHNGDILLNIKNNEIEVKAMKDNSLLAKVPVYSSYSKTEIHIENEKNANHNKIVIKNDFNILDDNLDESFEIYFESCGQIPIDFVDWNEEKLSGFLFILNNDLYDIYDEYITNINSPYLKYKFNIDEENNYFDFPADAKSVVLCLSSDTCSQPELARNNVYQHPINGQDIKTVITLLNDYIQANPNIEKLSLVLNDAFDGQELSLPSTIANLKFISFIYNNNEKTEPLYFTLSSFPTKQVDMEIIKCSITANSVVNIGQLFTSETGEITSVDPNINFVTSTKIDQIDISKKDETIQLSGNNILKLVIQSSTSPHKIIFEAPDEKAFDCTIYIQANDRNYVDIPISFSEKQQQTESSNKLQIRICDNERIIFTSIPTNIETTILDNEGETVQFYIPIKSENCLQDKVSICYNNNRCNQYDKSEMYFSSLTENDFTSLIELFKQDDTKVYQYIRLIFQNNMDYENVNFHQIPASQFKQIQLTSYGETGESYIILNDEIENENITSWLFEPKVYLWRSNDEKFFYFNEMSTNLAGEDFILELLDNIYNNYYIETFHIPSEFVSVYNYLRDSNLIGNFGKINIEITPIGGVCSIKCTDNNVIVGDDDTNVIQNPDLLYLYYQILDDDSQSQTIKISRNDETINQANFIINKESGSVTFDFECTETSANDKFELNLYMMNKDVNVNINQNSCKNIDYYNMSYTANDVPSYPEINDGNESYKISDSTEYEFINEGYKSKEKGNDTTVKNPTFNKIIFTQHTITIYETGSFESSTPLYFEPNQENAIIVIKEGVHKSNIGVTSNNSPRIRLEKNENPLSFMNSLSNGGFINIIYEKDANTDLFFNEINNNQGPFHLNVYKTIKRVYFTDIKMSQTSSFEVRHKEEVQNSNAKLIKSDADDENEYPNIIAKETVIISPGSNSTIRNLELQGSLFIYDDSTLNLIGKTVFSNESMINLTINPSNSTDDQEHLLIQCENKLDTIPSSINISLITSDDENNEVSDLQIIGPFNSSELCDELGDQIYFECEKDYSFSHKCVENDGEVFLTFTAKEKGKKSKKLSAGAIAGIVIACIVVVALIIGLIVFCIKRKKNNNLPSTGDENDDYSCAY